MKLIPLSVGDKNHPNPKNKGKYVALVDDEDYDELIKIKWRVAVAKHSQYAIGYICQGHTVAMHRLVMRVTDSKVLIDHKDRNGLNCQKYNLRECTKSQNAANSKSYGKSKYLGVCWHKKSGKWQSSMRYNGKSIHLGIFKDEDEAAKAYDKKADELQGEFANLNFKKTI